MREGKGKSLVTFPSDYCVVDIETTGLSYSCSIIEISAIKVRNNVIYDAFSSLIRPDSCYIDLDTGICRYVDKFIESLTGITNEMLEKSDDITTVLPQFINFVGEDLLVGHNFASFDSNFLYDACIRILSSNFSNDYIDTMRLSKWLLPELEHHRLVDLCEYFNIDSSGMHRGSKDCEITFHCLNALKNVALSKYETLEKFYEYYRSRKSKSAFALKASDIKTDVTDFDISNPLYGSICVFTGTLEKMTRREAMQIVKNLGGENGDNVTQNTNFLILGNNDFCKSIKGGKSNKQKKAEKLKASGFDIEVISESVFYDMAGIQ